VTYRMRSKKTGELIVWDVVSQLKTSLLLVGAAENTAPWTSTALADWVEEGGVGLQHRTVLGTRVTITFEFGRVVDAAAAGASRSWFGASTSADTHDARLEASLIDLEQVMASWWRDMAHHAEPIAAGEAVLVSRGFARPPRVRVTPSAKVIQRQWRSHQAALHPPPEVEPFTPTTRRKVGREGRREGWITRAIRSVSPIRSPSSSPQAVRAKADHQGMGASDHWGNGRPLTNGIAGNGRPVGGTNIGDQRVKFDA